MSVTYSPIGTIHTPFSSLEGMPIQPSGAKDVAGTITLLPALNSFISTSAIQLMPDPKKERD